MTRLSAARAGWAMAASTANPITALRTRAVRLMPGPTSRDRQGRGRGGLATDILGLPGLARARPCLVAFRRNGFAFRNVAGSCKIRAPEARGDRCCLPSHQGMSAHMNIVIPDGYQDMVDRLDCYGLIRHHTVTRCREPARDFAELVERLRDADVVVAIRERVTFSRALLAELPRLKLIALVGRNAKTIDFAACTELGIPVATGKSSSPEAPAELTLALIMASRRNVVLEAERMKRGDWPCTLSHRLCGSTLGVFGLGQIGELVARGGRGLGMEILVFGQEASLRKAAALG